jgi:hypothetical protein
MPLALLAMPLALLAMPLALLAMPLAMPLALVIILSLPRQNPVLKE